MRPDELPVARVAIACGGTGGHLFPGLAVAEELKQHGCAVTLLISPKEVDQQAVKSATGLKIATLPAVGLSEGKRLAFARGFLRSFRGSRKLFRAEPPEAVLAMGGFTSAAPLLVGRMLGAPVFLHESNTIPGRANRWLSRLVYQAAFWGVWRRHAPVARRAHENHRHTLPPAIQAGKPGAMPRRIGPGA